MTGNLPVRRKDFHDQLGGARGDSRHQRDAQDRLRLVRHLHRGGGYLGSVPCRECSSGLSVQSDDDGLSGEAGTSVSILNPERNRGHVILLRTGEGRHVECAPVTVVRVQKAGSGARVARARIACRDHLAGGLCDRRGTCWRRARCWGRRRGRSRVRSNKSEGGGDECRQTRGPAKRLLI
jgi:hypothetical protein